MNAPDLAALFPPSPKNIPAGLTKASAAYTRHAWLALLGLFAFVGLYLGLIGWLASTVWRLVAHSRGDELFGGAILSIPPLFFLAFLLRGLMLARHKPDASLVEITAADQPTLFAFIHRLADETGAPRPHRVFLSARVNASVFYDLSFWNLVFPSKKNLELGLGLVNVLSLDEFKAVIAHEFGHFAQKTMAVGRWVYLAQQIAGQIVVSRSAFDSFLTGLSRTDIRIAWVGWILRLFVWAIRAVLDTAFRLVVLAHRALGREMEFAADRVAVSVSGSDSLVHALHRLGPADQAWEEAVSFAIDELNAKRPVEDLFVYQTRALAELRRILDEPEFGATPTRPDDGTDFRVFEEGLAQPPRMWLTHPPSRDREESAKALYVESPLDERSAWELFADVPALRKAATEKLFVKKEDGTATTTTERQKLVETPAPVDTFAKRYSRAALDPRFRGAYLGRSIAAHTDDPSSLRGSTEATGPELLEAIDSLYPPSLRQDLKDYRERKSEVAQLEGLADGVLTAPGGVIRYRGKELRRKELRGVIDSVKAERDAVEARLLEHDRSVRATHLSAAESLGNGWAEHLKSLTCLVHFTTHCLRDLGDAYGKLHHVLDIVLADGNVSDAERQRVIVAARDLFLVTSQIWEAKNTLALSDDVDEAFGAAGGFQVLNDELGLLQPTQENLGDWLRVMEGWVRGALADLSLLSDVALDRLLEVETQVARWLRDGGDVPEAPSGMELPETYPMCLKGQERERQKRLDWWDRFQTADGFVPGALRAGVASALLFSAMFIGGNIGTPTVHIYNGLNVPVMVELQGSSTMVAAHNGRSIDAKTGAGHVTTTLADGTLVESFDVDVAGGFSHTAYNVANASALLEWYAVYGGGSSRPPMKLGAPRWLEARQDHVFSEPPTSVSLKQGQTAVHEVLAGFSDSPFRDAESVSDPAERAALISAHVSFDAIDDTYDRWADLAATNPTAKAALAKRIDASPNVVVLQRHLQDDFGDEAHDEACARTNAALEKSPDDADLTYLSLRCHRGDADYVSAWKRNPHHAWLAWGSMNQLVAAGSLHDTQKALEVAGAGKPSGGPTPGSVALEHLRLWRYAKTLRIDLKQHVSVQKAPDGSAVDFVKRIEAVSPAANEALEVTVLRAFNFGNFTLAEATMAPLNKATRARVSLQIAASDGAKPTPLGKEQTELTWIRTALSLRAGEPVSSKTIEWLSPEVSARVFSALLARDEAALETEMKPHGLRMRGVISAMGAIVFGADAPPAWRREAMALLFPYERPYFKTQ